MITIDIIKSNSRQLSADISLHIYQILLSDNKIIFNERIFLDDQTCLYYLKHVNKRAIFLTKLVFHPNRRFEGQP